MHPRYFAFAAALLTLSSAQAAEPRHVLVDCTVFKEGHRTNEMYQFQIEENETKKVVEKDGYAFQLTFENPPVGTGEPGKNDTCEYWQVFKLRAEKGGEEVAYASSSIRAGLAGFLELRVGKGGPHLDCTNLTYTGDWVCP